MSVDIEEVSENELAGWASFLLLAGDIKTMKSSSGKRLLGNLPKVGHLGMRTLG